MIPIARPLIGDAEIAAVVEVLRSGQLAQGPRVKAFEDAFAEWSGAEFAVATSSGTSALHIALLACGIGSGDEVITSSFSFVASANSILFVGARPIFADIEADYYTISPAAIEAQITSRTKAIIPVHMYGQFSDMLAIAEIAEEHDLIVIQDACQAHGASLNGKPVGAYGTACYSFYPTKNITTAEGGMLTTNDRDIAEKARMLRNHGSQRRYHHESLGYNLRMTEIQAAIGLAQLEKVDIWNEKRKANAARLTELIGGIDRIEPPVIRPGSDHVFHQYTVRFPDRDRAADELTSHGIGVGVHYPTPIYNQPLYQQLGYDLMHPETERACREVLSLPVHPSLTSAELETIGEAVALISMKV